MVIFFSRNCKRDILPIRLSSLHLEALRKVTQDNGAMQHNEPKPYAQFAVIQSERKEFRNPGSIVPAVAAWTFSITSDWRSESAQVATSTVSPIMGTDLQVPVAE